MNPRKQKLLEVFSIYDAIDRCGIKDALHGNICCPFHADSSPSMHIYGDTNKAFCFTCAKSWDAIAFVADYQKRRYYDVMDELCSERGITISNDFQREIKAKEIIKVEVLSGLPKRRLKQILENWDFWVKKIFEY